MCPYKSFLHYEKTPKAHPYMFEALVILPNFIFTFLKKTAFWFKPFFQSILAGTGAIKHVYSSQNELVYP
jgi:hypothetical protein